MLSGPGAVFFVCLNALLISACVKGSVRESSSKASCEVVRVSSMNFLSEGWSGSSCRTLVKCSCAIFMGMSQWGEGLSRIWVIVFFLFLA